MTLKSYLNFYELLHSSNSTRTQKREFGLLHASLKDRPVQQLLKWTEKFSVQLSKPLLSEVLSSYLYGITLTLTIIAFFIGVFSGVGLLSYSGNEPVNVIYFIAMVIFIPFITIIIALISMFRVNSRQSMLIHISPAFWMEKILNLLPNKMDKYLKISILELKLNPLIINWLIIKRSQILALTFSFGLLFSLLIIIVTKDIAFAWSTTLNITPENFYNFLYNLSFAWRDLFPWAVPSLELVEQSQYYRLGEKLNINMINNASLLGEWWKFLLLATLFYAIILRIIMVIISSIALNRAITISFLTLDGSQKLLNDMNEPIISTASLGDESNFISKNVEYKRVVKGYEKSYDNILGWALSNTKLELINDSMGVVSKNIYEVGGSNTLTQDNNVIDKCYGNILIYVKAWEPPTMDFMDFIEILLEKTDKIIVAPIGTQKKHYITNEKELNIWAKKLYILNSQKVWFKI